MFAIVYKEDSVPMCAHLSDDRRDAVVFWASEERARGFLSAKGDDFLASYDVVRLDEEGIQRMAAALNCRDEEIELIPFPS